MNILNHNFRCIGQIGIILSLITPYVPGEIKCKSCRRKGIEALVSVADDAENMKKAILELMALPVTEEQKGRRSAVLNDVYNNKKNTEKIIADTDINGKDTGGKCALPPAKGLLCPLAYIGGLTQSHKPRLLVSYRAVVTHC